MTENEVINVLTEHTQMFVPVSDLEALEIAVEALEEVQEYRKIGTVEELSRASRYIMLAKKHGTIGQMIDECAAYEEIGTLEEVGEAVEKQKPKKPDYEGDGYDKNGHIIYDTWICPNCGKKYEVDYDDYKHCPNCGQAIKIVEKGGIK